MTRLISQDLWVTEFHLRECMSWYRKCVLHYNYLKFGTLPCFPVGTFGSKQVSVYTWFIGQLPLFPPSTSIPVSRPSPSMRNAVSSASQLAFAQMSGHLQIKDKQLPQNMQTNTPTQHLHSLFVLELLIKK